MHTERSRRIRVITVPAYAFIVNKLESLCVERADEREERPYFAGRSFGRGINSLPLRPERPSRRCAVREMFA